MDPQYLVGKIIKSKGIVQRRILSIIPIGCYIGQNEILFRSEWTRDNFEHITPEKIPLWYLEELLSIGWTMSDTNRYDEEML
jgi:hypothetical protein